MRYTPLNVAPEYPISAVVGETAPAPTSPWVKPGFYIITLTVNGQKYAQTIEIKMDPRVKTPIPSIMQQFDLASICYVDRKNTVEGLKAMANIKTAIQTMLLHCTPALSDTLKTFLRNCDSLKLDRIDYKLKVLFDAINGVDAAPTSQCVDAVKATDADYKIIWAKWESLKEVLKRAKGG